jgi:hypothetical protein
MVAFSSAAIQFRKAGIGGSFGFAAITPAIPISVLGSSVANKISFSRSPGRMPVNTISTS